MKVNYIKYGRWIFTILILLQVKYGESKSQTKMSDIIHGPDLSPQKSVM